MLRKLIESMHSFDVLVREFHSIQVYPTFLNLLLFFFLEKRLINGFRQWLFLDASHADSDAVLLLENTKYQNYTNENRLTGFDTGTALAILKVFQLFYD